MGFLGVFGPGAGGFPDADAGDADGVPDGIFGLRVGGIGRQALLRFVEDGFGEDLGGGVFGFKGHDPLAKGGFELLEVGVLGVDADGVVEALDVIAHGVLEHLEIADHLVLVELIGLQDELDFARVAMGKFAEVRMLRQHVTALDFK